MTIRLPADLYRIARATYCTAGGATLSIGWKFGRKSDVGMPARWRRVYYLDFDFDARSFSGQIKRDGYTLDQLTPAEVNGLRSLLPAAELAAALALSITRSAP